MIRVKAKVKKWGNSLAVLIPSQEAKIEGLKDNDEVDFTINKKKKNPLKELWGKYKFSESTDKMLKEADKELWNDD